MIGLNAACRLLLVGVLAMSAIGCDSKPQRFPIHGRVMIDGKPAFFGSIMFVPDGVGPKAAATIQDGSYEIDAYRGPLAGSMVVEIMVPKFSPDQAIPENIDELMHLATAAPPLLPARYNTASELRVNVTDDGPNEFNFDLTTK
jgi:hypothetical protein